MAVESDQLKSNQFSRKNFLKIMNILPLFLAARYCYAVYAHYAWHPPQTWEIHEVDPDIEIKNIAEQAGIRKDLKFYSMALGEDDSAMAFGNNSFKASSLAILVVPDIDITNKMVGYFKNVRSVLLKHEIAHLKYNDIFFRSAAAATASVASLVFGFIFMKPLMTSFLIFILARITSICYSRFMERRADTFAIENSSIDELNSFLRAVKECIERNAKLHAESLEGKFKYSYEGNSHLDWEHDPLTRRVKKFEVAILQLQNLSS